MPLAIYPQYCSETTNCCLILLQMRFTSHNCYQLCGSLLHCLFTLTIFMAVIFLLHYLSKPDYTRIYVVTKFCPVVTRHFFRRSPDFLSSLKTIIRIQESGYIPSAKLLKKWCRFYNLHP